MAGIAELLRRARARDAMGKGGGAATRARLGQGRGEFSGRPGQTISDKGYVPPQRQQEEQGLSAARGMLYVDAVHRAAVAEQGGTQVGLRTQARLQKGGGFLGPLSQQQAAALSPDVLASLDRYRHSLRQRAQRPGY